MASSSKPKDKEKDETMNNENLFTDLEDHPEGNDDLQEFLDHDITPDNNFYNEWHDAPADAK